MEPLPTIYKGVTYRSRAEARWAVVFEKLGWKHFYEPEAFSLKSGHYLPDFYLSDVDAYFEVKGKPPTFREKLLAEELCESTDTVVLISTGPPNPDRKLFDEDLIVFVPERDEGDEVIVFPYGGGFVDRRRSHHPACSIDLGNLGHLGSVVEIAWRTAFRAAANTRFGIFE